MTIKVLILNAPSRSGKDTLANWIVDNLPNTAHLKFATFLKNMTHKLYDILGESNLFEDSKDIPNPSFFGLTPRQAYINLSEKYIKPIHGFEFFGERLVEEIFKQNRWIDNNLKFFVISDGGFIEEIMPLIKKFGCDNVKVLPLIRSEYTFEGDSRNYVDYDTLAELGVKVYPFLINNNLDSFLHQGLQIAQDFFI